MSFDFFFKMIRVNFFQNLANTLLLCCITKSTCKIRVCVDVQDIIYLQEGSILSLFLRRYCNRVNLDGLSCGLVVTSKRFCCLSRHAIISWTKIMVFHNTTWRNIDFVNSTFRFLIDCVGCRLANVIWTVLNTHHQFGNPPTTS